MVEMVLRDTVNKPKHIYSCVCMRLYVSSVRCYAIYKNLLCFIVFDVDISIPALFCLCLSLSLSPFQRMMHDKRCHFLVRFILCSRSKYLNFLQIFLYVNPTFGLLNEKNCILLHFFGLTLKKSTKCNIQ